MQINKFKILYFTIFMLFGVLLASWVDLSKPFLFLSLAFCLISMLYLKGKASFLLPFLLFGLLFGLVRVEIEPKETLIPQDWKGEWVTIIGKVKSFPKVSIRGKKRTVKFEIQSQAIEKKGIRYSLKEKFLVTGFGGFEVPGNQSLVRLRGKLQVPKRAGNPGQFDYRQYLKKQRIRWVLYSFGENGIDVLKEKRNFFERFLIKITKLREKIRDAVHRDFKDEAIQALTLALTIGDRGNIPFYLKDQFIVLGIMHLLAISGLHISILGVFFYHSLVLFRLPRLYRILLTLLMLNSFSFISGYQLPVIRATYMGSLYLLADVLRRERDFVKTITVVFLGFIVWNPQAIYLAGFQLSFVAVFSIVLLTPIFLKRKRGFQDKNFVKQTSKKFIHYLKGTFLSTLTAILGTFPILAYHFNLFSTLDLVANIFSIPFITFILSLNFFYFLSLFLPTGFNILIVKILNGIYPIFLKGISFLSEMPFAAFSIISPSVFSIFAYYFLIGIFVFMYLRRKGRNREIRFGLLFTFFFFVCFLFWSPKQSFSSRPTLNIKVLDCGNNDVSLIQLPSKVNLLINTGGGFPSQNARWIITPFLRNLGVNRIDLILMRSLSSKHWGGFSYLYRYFHPQLFFIPDEKELFVKRRKDKGLLKKIKKQTILFDEDERVFDRDGVILSVGKRKNQKSHYPLQLTYGKTEVVFGMIKNEKRDKDSELQRVLILSKKDFDMLEELSDLNRFDIVVIQGKIDPKDKAVISEDILLTSERGMVSLQSDGLKWTARTFR